MNLTAYFIRYPRTLAIILVTLMAWAISALITLPRQESPVITWRLANVITRLPGAPTERVEALISDALEKRIAEVDGVEHVYSVSRVGLSLVQVELSDEVTEAEPVWQKVRQKLTEAAGVLPEGVVGPELDDEIAGTFAALVAVTGDSQSYRQLKDHAQRLDEDLRWLPSTASTSLFGVQPEVIEVRVDPAKLAAYSLSFRQLVSALEGRNVRRPAGRLRTQSSELVIEVSGEWASEHDVAETLLPATTDGRTIKIRDVAAVVRTERNPPEPLARANGKPAIVVGVRARQDLRIDEYGDRVAEVVQQFTESLPAGVGVSVLNDLGRYTREREQQLAMTMVWSIIGVFLSTALFMNLRACAIVAAAIPVTIAIVLVGFSLLGIPLNEMSAMAMIMAMGLLVDNAILVTEQIDRRMSDGTPAAIAAAEEPARLITPLVVSTLTTAVAFLPIYLLPGGVGEFVRAIPIALGLSLLVSLVVAVTVTPTLCAWVWRKEYSESDHRPAIPAMAEVYRWIEDKFFRLLERAVTRPGLTIVAALLVTAGCASLGLLLRRDFFSPVQRDQFIVDVYARQGSSLAHTADVVRQVEEILLPDDDVVRTGSFIGRNAPLVFYNLTSQETYATHFAQIVVQVSDWSHTARTAQRIQAQLHKDIAGAECCARILEHGAPLLAPFEVRISGPSIETLTELGRRASDILRSTPGARNVRSNFGSEAVKLVAQVNEPVARSLGIDERTVAEELAGRLDGAPAGFVREGDERIDVELRQPVERRGGSPDLASIYLKPTPDARLIPLASVATLNPTWEPAGIHRRDGRRTLTVLGYPDFGLTAAQVAARFKDKINALAAAMPAGYELSLGGENEQRNEAETNLMFGGVYAFWVIVLLILAEFRSFRLTALVGAVIVLSLSGGLVALWLTGWPLNFMAMMGMIMHAGVAENDAVVLIDGFERRRRAGEPLTDLILAGTRERMRHVLITSTSIGGYLPLAMSDSLLWPPLAIVMIGGLALSTLLTLIVVPAAYRLLWRS